MFADMFSVALKRQGGDVGYQVVNADRYRVDGDTVFDLAARTVEGRATAFTEILRNQLRRNGIRFRVVPVNGSYEPWKGVLTSA